MLLMACLFCYWNPYLELFPWQRFRGCLQDRSLDLNSNFVLKFKSALSHFFLDCSLYGTQIPLKKPQASTASTVCMLVMALATVAQSFSNVSFFDLDFLLFEKPLSAKTWSRKFRKSEFLMNSISSVKHLDVTFTVWVVC